LVDVQTVSVVIAAASVVAFVINSIITSRREEKRSQQTMDTRQAQLFMGLYDKFSSAEYAENLMLIQEWKVDSLEDFMKMLGDRDRSRIWLSTFMIYESIGVLVHENLIDIRIVARYTGRYRFDWEKWGPYIKQARELRKRPRMLIEAEYLYDRLMEFGRSHPDYGIV
jgi:hypothetical protein